MQKVDVQVTCDLPTHRRRLDASEDVESLSFSFDGREFEIDLCPQHAKDFQEKVGLFERYARKASRRTGRKAARTRNRERGADIREWAREHGYQISERGRIPANIVSAYDAGH